MPKTKTQAQKRQEREEKQRETKENVDARKAERDNALREHYERQKAEPLPNSILNNAEKRALKEEKKNATRGNFQPNFFTIDTANVTNKMASNRDQLHEAVINELQEREENEISNPARIVENHSTYCPGLKVLLVKLQKVLPGATLSPGPLSHVKVNYEHFELLFQRQLDENRYTFVARSGQTAQDLTIIVKQPEIYTVEFVCDKIANIIDEKKQYDEDSFDDYTEISPSELNHSLAKAQSTFWMEKNQREHQKEKDRNQGAKKEKDIKIQERKLANKNLDPKDLRAYAERDAKIIHGEARTRNSMR